MFKVAMLLLTIIYLAFISLGLPDAVLGAAWPTISQDINSSLEYAGAVSIIISAGTVISSLFATRIIHHIGTGPVVAISVLMTACALLGFSSANYILVMALLAIPLGLGAGAVDAALNNFVALHYKSKHMNYLHSFWGVGASVGPFIMAAYLMSVEGWRSGYETIAYIQFGLVVIFFLTLPLWKFPIRVQHTENQEPSTLVTNREALHIKGVKCQLFVFWCYCALEAGTGLWAASYLTMEAGVAAEDAAFWTAMYFFGITVGRFFCGTIAEHFNEEALISTGVVMILMGVVGLLIPTPLLITKLSFVVIGLGCAPVFPNMIHLTPVRFGQHTSQAIIGLSMATAYLGSTLVPPIIGMVVGNLSFSYFPYILMLLSIAMVMATQHLKHKPKYTLEVQPS